VWDAFPYWRERWAVEARLRLWADLAPDVPYTPVALVGDRTHRGDPLPDGLPDLPAGVEAVSVTLDAGDDWGREAQQRDAVRLLLPRMEPDDLLLLCDADELVDPRVLPAILAATEHGPVKLRMLIYMCGTRWRHPTWWKHPAACRARDIPAQPTADLRMYFGPIPRPMPRVPDAGWHLTYYGSDEDVDRKLSAFAHAEHDTVQMRRELADLRHNGIGCVDEPLTGPLADILIDIVGAVAA
jgi:hypothetical protein